MPGMAFRTFFIALVFLAMVAGSVALDLLPVQFFWLYVVMSVVTFLVYAKDKSSARKDWQRTPERRLHLLALLGGWPGALYAQQQLRHKNRKTSFQAVFWLTLVLNICALGYLMSGHGKWLSNIFI